jgi:hypothetical protein
VGTLGSQFPRLDHLSSYASAIRQVLKDMGVKRFEEATPRQIHAACDVVRTCLAIQSADYLDEALGGFGDVLSKYVDDHEPKVEL